MSAFSTGFIGICDHDWLLKCKFWKWNLVLRAYKATILSTEPSPQLWATLSQFFCFCSHLQRFSSGNQGHPVKGKNKQTNKTVLNSIMSSQISQIQSQNFIHDPPLVHWACYISDLLLHLWSPPTILPHLPFITLLLRHQFLCNLFLKYAKHAVSCKGFSCLLSPLLRVISPQGTSGSLHLNMPNSFVETFPCEQIYICIYICVYVCICNAYMYTHTVISLFLLLPWYLFSALFSLLMIISTIFFYLNDVSKLLISNISELFVLLLLSSRIWFLFFSISFPYC